MLIFISFDGCGGGGGGTAYTSTQNSSSSDKPIAVYGTITGNGYAKNSIINNFFNKIITPLYAKSINKPDTVLAIYGHGRKSKEFNISADGSFKINTSLLNRNDITFFIVNKITKKIYGHLNLSTDGNEKLDFIDKSLLRSGLDFGIVNTEKNCSSTTSLSGTSAFKTDATTMLKNISRNDDAVALYINNWKNPDIESFVSVQLRIAHLNDIVDKFNILPKNLKTVFTGKSPLFYLKKSVGTNISSIDLYPPSPIKYSKNVTDSKTFLDANQTVPIKRTGLSFNRYAQVTTVETSNVDNFPAGQ